MTPPSAERRTVIAVIGSGRITETARAAGLGGWIARRGYHLLTGGGGGNMRAVSEGFATVTRRSGLILGVLPGDARSGEAPEGYPNQFVELVIRTHLPQSGDRGIEPESRNHIIVLSADVIVALPGGAGTASEVNLAGRYGVPVVAHVADRSQIPRLSDDVPLADSIEEVAAFVDRQLQR